VAVPGLEELAVCLGGGDRRLLELCSAGSAARFAWSSPGEKQSLLKEGSKVVLEK